MRFSRTRSSPSRLMRPLTVSGLRHTHGPQRSEVTSRVHFRQGSARPSSLVKGQSMHGDRFGTHRVIAPAGTLPQAAQKLDNDTSKMFDNEIVLDVERLNIDSASFVQ